MTEAAAQRDDALARPGGDDDLAVERFRRLANLSDDVFLTLHHDGETTNVTWSSAGATTLLGVSAPMLASMPEGLSLHVHPQDRSSLLAALRESAPTVSYRWRRAGRADEPWTWLQLDLLEVPGEPGWFDGHIRSAEATHRLQQQMASAVEHETAALARLAEVEGLRDHILRSLSHRVRTPLAVLKACAQTALDPPGPLDEGQRTDLFARIGRASETLERLLADLLDLPSDYIVDLDDGGTNEDVATLLAGAVRATLGDDHPIVTQVAPGLRLAERASLVRRCIVHVLANVADHTPKGTNVLLTAKQTEAHTLTITVADNGPGLPAHVASHLFEPFVTGEDGADPGLGIGLAVVQHLMAQLGGKVHVRSQPGQGVRVTMAVPNDLGDRA